jgi:hypothetical protein
MIGVSLDALKQALGIVKESSKDEAHCATKQAAKPMKKSKKLVHRPLQAVVSLTQKVGPNEHV